MMSCAARGAPHPVAHVGSHLLPTVSVSRQPRGAVLLSHTVAACPHVLQVMMTLTACTSCKCFSNAQAYLAHTQV
jgi:hypothetical protein